MSVVLADGTQYSLQYNAYGEVARVTLPTGGMYVYKYPEASSCSPNTGSGVITLTNGEYTIQRMIAESDEYADGSHLSGKMLFSYSGWPSGLAWNNPSRPGIITTITFQDANSNTLRIEKHYFWGNPLSTAVDTSNPTQFTDWWFGLEFETAIFDGTSKLWQSQQRVYGQRPRGTGENCWYTPNSDGSPAHDPQLCQTNTGNHIGQVSGTALRYDQYNNISDKYEFDFGSAPAVGASCPSSFFTATRHTQTSYLPNANAVYAAPTVNILALPSWTAVFDGIGNQYAMTNFLYDQTSPTDVPYIVGQRFLLRNGIYSPRDLTTLQQWCSSCTRNNVYPAQSFTYDIAGNVLKSTDANGSITQFNHNDDDGMNDYCVCNVDRECAEPDNLIVLPLRHRKG